MDQEKIQITYAELKPIYKRVIEFTQAEADWYDHPNKNTRIEEDLGLFGLDNEEFLAEFSKKFYVNFDDMDYGEFLTHETEGITDGWMLFWPILIPLGIMKQLLRWLVFPFSKSFSNTINNSRLPFVKKSTKKDVTLGDLMVSIIKKEFTEKAAIQLELKPA